MTAQVPSPVLPIKSSFQSPPVGLVVETHCNYFAHISFPQTVQAGISVAHMGTSSVRYEIGVFGGDATHTQAYGHFVHVYVDKATRRPVPLPEKLKTSLEKLV
jgi:acyl-CoA thioester hydrolase